jgi:hypothetical protein
MCIHPKQADYYRRDKGGFFILAQVVVRINGTIRSIILGQGHNNYQGFFKLTKTNKYLENSNELWLADG